MSGHSHWSNIKRKKGRKDRKRSKIFAKLSRKIAVAARQESDPELNPTLRSAIEKAKEFDFPKENIKRAIKRGAGELEGRALEQFMFEATGPGKVGVIIEGITDNRNRALNKIREVLKQNKGKLAEEGAVRWAFERKGIITLQITNEYLPAGEAGEYTNEKKEDLELKAIEAGAEDLQWRKNYLEVITAVEDLQQVRASLKQQGIEIESSELGWVEKESLEVSEKTRKDCERLFEALNELDDIQEIYSNLSA